METVSPEVALEHGLTLDEYQRILDRLGRTPTLTELGIISVMWSEHCSYKSSRLHLKTLPTKGPRILVGPGENAGIVDIGGGYAAAFKIESHNHPSFVEPFQGAATGVGGILRDIFTMGARPIAVLDSLRFGRLDDPETGARNRRILQGVVSGISHYGNCFGVPTIGGECIFDAGYDGNPLVNVFALGIFKSDEIFFGSATGIGNPVIYVGAKTGKDGIKGASMASAEFDEDSEAKRPNVQVGDPFLEKLLLEACLEAMKTGAILGIQDMGAAGLTCSTCEMGGRSGAGIDVDLKFVPQREADMTPYEIMLSESQERMLLVAERGREGEVYEVFKKWGLDAAEIGTVTDDGLLRVRNHGEIVAELENSFLTDDAPLYDRPHTTPHRSAPFDGPVLQPIDGAAGLDALKKILSAPDICSKRWIYEQYDYQVRTNTTAGPGGDAAVVRVKEAGVSLAISLDGNADYCSLDPKEGAKLAVAEACRNLATVGAVPLGTTNCLNFGNPERPEIMAQLVAAIDGIREACSHFETPITGGNVSLYNETLGSGIAPTPVLGVVGLIENMDPPPGIAFKNPGRAVILLGGAECDQSERRFGSSQYAKEVVGQTWGLPPQIDLDFEKRLQAAVRQIVREGLVESAHDLSDGGLAVALAESSFGQIGARVDLECTGLELFDESPSRVLFSVTEENLERVRRIAQQNQAPMTRIGDTVRGRLEVQLRGQAFFGADVRDLHEVWDRALEGMLKK